MPANPASPQSVVVLDEAEEREAGELKRKLGTVFLRGDTITIISPTQH